MKPGDMLTKYHGFPGTEWLTGMWEFHCKNQDNPGQTGMLVLLGDHPILQL